MGVADSEGTMGTSSSNRKRRKPKQQQPDSETLTEPRPESAQLPILWILSMDQGVIAIGGLKSCILMCNSFRLCICTLDLNNTSVKLCNSFLSLNVILDVKCMYCISFESLCKVM
uniref:Uncharacterized protein n=1 Tax=Opuntia streptacantha TaxID=393608 RepID=A0A7C9CSG8_OPUST